MLEQVRKTISRYNMLPPGSRAIVAISGGPDSVCLLHALVELAPELGIEVEAAHLNHQLRGEESDADEQFVKDLATRLRVKLHVAHVDVAARAKSLSGNLEQEARRARLQFFRELLARNDDRRIAHIATGHTRDDQAETVLLRILRGSGLAGLAGIHPVTGSGLVRPLLDVTRADVLQFLEAHRATWREDSSNRDLRFSRNAIRHESLPQLSERWNHNLSEALAHLADITFEEESWWRSDASPLAAIAQMCVAGGVELDVRALQHLPRAVQRRVIRRAIAKAKGDLRQVEFQHVERVIDLATGSKGTGRLELPGCLDVRRSFDWLRLAAPDGLRISAYGKDAYGKDAGEKDTPQKAPPVEAVAMKIPGTCLSPDGKSLIKLGIVDPKSPAEACANLKSEVVRLGPVPRELHLRGWRPGDRYRPRGQTKVRKLKEMFSEARIPSWQRRTWPILISGSEILWSRQFGAAADGDAGGNNPVLCISELGQVPEIVS